MLLFKCCAGNDAAKKLIDIFKLRKYHHSWALETLETLGEEGGEEEEEESIEIQFPITSGHLGTLQPNFFPIFSLPFPLPQTKFTMIG